MVLVPCPELVGRADELASLRRALADAARRRGRVVALSGEAGVGKSRLLQELVAEAARHDVPVLVGRAVETANPSPYRPLAEALLSHLRRSERGARPQLEPFRPVLDRLVPGWAPGDSAVGDVSTVLMGEAVLRLLRAVGERSGCLLALEDLHWADPETVDVVEYLADNVADEPLLCLATVRADETTDAVRRLGALAARRAADTVHVRRLGAAQAEAMATACLAGDPVSAPLRRLVVATAEGLPFLVEELLTTAVDTSDRHRAPSGPPPVPDSFAETVRRRLAAVPGAADVLRAAALIGRRFDWDLLPVTIGLSEEEVVARLRDAADRRLITVETTDDGTRFRFRHALTRAAVLAEMLPPERAALAARALPVVEAAHPGLPGQWCELAAQLADQAGQPARAAPLFLEAGRRALAQGALVTAQASLDRARLLAGADRDLGVEVDDALCSALALAGDAARLSEVGERLLAGLTATAASPTRLATVHLRLARAAVAAADWASAEERLHRADGYDVDALRAEADVLAAQVALGRDRPERAGELAQRALVAAEGRGSAELACEALEVVGRRERQRDLAAAERAFAAALDRAQRHGLVVWRVRALHELGTIDLLAGGPATRLVEARQAAYDAGALGTAATVGLQLAAWHLNHVELDPVVDTTREFAAEAHRLRMPLLEALAALLEAGAYALGGRRGEMESALGTALALGGDVPEVRGGAALQVRASYWLVREDRARATDALDEGMALLRTTLATTPFRGMWALVHALDDRDGPAAVEEVERSGLTVYWLVRGWVGHARAVLLGRAGRRDEAAQAFAAADATLAPCPWYRQHARRLVAEAAVVDGWGEPEVWLTEALHFFDQAGYDRIASACRALLRRAGAAVPRRPRRPAEVPERFAGLGLTARELDVLTLLGEAQPTRDIATQLFVSPKTVERHIANLATKLGLQGRAELIAFAARRAAPGT